MPLSLKTLRRELRSGEIRLLFAALAIAVAAVTAVAFFTDRVRLALEREAQLLIGGDLVLISDQPLPRVFRDEALARGLEVAETMSFPSMVMANGAAQLAEIKAVSDTYPLRGSLSIAAKPGESGRPAKQGPVRGVAWGDERLAGALGSASGDVLGLGSLSLRMDAILISEPDRGINFLSLAPRLMVHIADIPGSGLIQPGSRISYRLLVAGETASVVDYRQWINGRLARGLRLEDVRNARPEIRSALDRAQRFLGLSSLLTVVLSSVAVALASRRYMGRHLDACAVMRCLGMTQNRLIRLHLSIYLWLAAFGVLVGLAIGFGAHFVLVGWLSELLLIPLPPPGISPLMLGVSVGFVLLFGFGLPPLLQLAAVPTLRVLRRELGPARPATFGGYLFGLLLLSGLVVTVAGDLLMGGLAVGGFILALGVFWGLAWAAVGLMGRLRTAGGFGWRQGLASLLRHRAATTLQVVALAIGLMAMLLLTVTRGELLAAWQKSMPVDAPNRFVINIQAPQRDQVARLLSDAGVLAELSPMIRGRLISIEDRPVSAASYPDDDRAQRLIERDFNLSWRADMPAGNRLVAGAWFSLSDTGQGLASVEEGLAKTLGISLGDKLVFSIAGEEKAVRVSSLRKLEWDSMRVNFFVLMPPGVIENAPASYITSFYLPPEKASLGRDLVGRFPNLTLIDVDALIRQFQSVIGKVALVVQFVFAFSLLVGVIVLYSALMVVFDARRYEFAVMRALGARREQLRRALLVELAVIGGVAGLLAATGAGLLGQAIAWRAFQMAVQFPLALPLYAMSGGALLTVGCGWLAVSRLMRSAPMLALRAGS